MLLLSYINITTSITLAAWKRRDAAASGKPRGNAKRVAKAFARHCFKSVATLGTRVRLVRSRNDKLTTHVQSTQVPIAALSIRHRRHQDQRHQHGHLHEHGQRRLGRAGRCCHLLLLYFLSIMKYIIVK